MKAEIETIAGFTWVGGDEPPRSWDWREAVAKKLPRKYEVEWDEGLEEVTVRELLG